MFVNYNDNQHFPLIVSNSAGEIPEATAYAYSLQSSAYHPLVSGNEIRRKELQDKMIEAQVRAELVNSLNPAACIAAGMERKFGSGGEMGDGDEPNLYGSTQEDAVVTGHRMPGWKRFLNKNLRSKNGWERYMDRYYARQQHAQDAVNDVANRNSTYEVPDALSTLGNIQGAPMAREDQEREKAWDIYYRWIMNSEVIGPHFDPDGNYVNAPYRNPSAGYLSPVDPVGAFAVGTAALSPVGKAGSTVLNAGKAVLTPGSSFWMSPATQQFVRGATWGTGADAVSTLFTGRTLGENAREIVNRTTGWDGPSNSWLATLYNLGTDVLANPGYWVTEGMEQAAGKGLNATVENLVDKYPGVVQYPRYALGKFKYGFDAELPTVYRKLISPHLPEIDEKGMMSFTHSPSRFRYVETGEDPLITNFSTDVPVRSHSWGDWDIGETYATKGTALLGHKVVSTRPSDTFTVGAKVRVPTKKVTLISGNEQLLKDASNKGFKTVTSDNLKKIAKAHEVEANSQPKGRFDLEKDDYSDYAEAMNDAVRASFKTPTIKDYQFMDYVFKPVYKSEVEPLSNLAVYRQMSPELWPTWLKQTMSNAASRRLLPELDNVLYHPSTYAEAQYRTEKGIEELKKIPTIIRNNWNKK